MPRGVKKENLPSKICPVCNRPFTWRKVWEKCWDEVVCCSDRCKNERKKQRQQERPKEDASMQSTSQRALDPGPTARSPPAAASFNIPHDRMGALTFGGGSIRGLRAGSFEGSMNLSVLANLARPRPPFFLATCAALAPAGRLSSRLAAGSRAAWGFASRGVPKFA